MSQAGINNTSSGPVPPDVPTSFVTDSGTAVPAANVINVVTPGGGTEGIMTSAAGNTITVTLTDILVGTATTVGATTANINVAIPIPVNSATSLLIDISGYDAINGHAAGGESISLVRNVAGVLTVVSTASVSKNNDLALMAWSIGMTTVGTNAFVQVTGVAGTTIQWRAFIEAINAP